MGHILGFLFWDIPGWLVGGSLLDQCIFGSIEVAGDLEINSLHMGGNRADKLPYNGGVLFINSTSLTLNKGRRTRVWNLLQVPQWGIFGHSHCPPQTHEAGLGRQQAPRSFQHPRSPRCTTSPCRLQGPSSGQQPHQLRPNLSFLPLLVSAPCSPA